MNKRVGIMTLGCRVNQYETQACQEIFEAHGYRACPPEPGLDAYFLNTCSVTGESDRKSRQAMNRLLGFSRENNAPVIVCGCHVQAGQEIEYRPNLFVCGNADKAAFVEQVLAGQAPQKRIPRREDMHAYYPMTVSKCKNTRAYVKIEDGCDNFCTYCIVAHVRGPVRSRPKEQVLDEVKLLAKNGYREVVLTGIETSFYGKDLEENYDLADLARDVGEIAGIQRIRFGSLRPTLFTEDFCQRLSQNPKVMPHFHLSVQSGSNKVLWTMGRNYTREDVLRVFENVRRYFKTPTFGADVICGFPGETQADFEESADLIEKGGFLHTHIFPYSQRPGTPAAQIRPQIDVSLRKQRSTQLIRFAERIAKETLLDHVGIPTGILVETLEGKYAYGYTDGFIYTKFENRHQLLPGDITQVTLTDQMQKKRGLWCVLGQESTGEIKA